MIQKRHNPYPSLAEIIRQQGRNGDTVLAHINPIEAQILKDLGGSGKINPKTGIPEFGWMPWHRSFKPGKGHIFKNPKRAIADTIGIASAVFGGPAGGAVGGGLRAAMIGRNPLMGALQGAGYGTVAPMAANLAGQGLSALGANTLGSSLQNYATSNMGSWLGNAAQVGQGIRGLGLPFTGGNSSLNLFDNGNSNLFNNSSSLANMISGGGRGETSSGYSGLGVGAGSDAATAEDLPFMDKLLNKSSDFFSEPSNLLTSAVLASSFMNRPKKETPEKRARDEKTYQKGLMLTSDELQQKEAQDLALAQMKRRVERNKFLPEERFAIDPLYVKSNTPEEYKKSGRWLNYYNNPDFSGEPLVMKKGGSVNLTTQRTSLRTDTINKAKELSQRLIDDVLKSNSGKLDESALIQGFTAINNNLNLNEEEKYQVERFVENIFKNYQFTDGPGYFYSQSHKNSNPAQASFKRGGEVRVTSYLKNKFVPKERFFNETLDFLPKKRFTIKPLVKKKGGLASFIT